jgi:hypothetical protein
MPAKKQKSDKSTSSKKSSGCFPAIATALLIIIAAGLIYWFLPNIINWGTATWKNLFRLFGLGLAIIAIYIVLIIIMLGGQRLLLLIKYWNRWLGGISLTLAVWGLLAFINSKWGGTFGKDIITTSPAVGTLRLLGLAFLGFLLIFPKQTWHAIEATIFKESGWRFKVSGDL